MVVWLRNLVKELPGNSEQDEPTQIYEDNQGCIAMTEAETSGKRTKYIDVRYHYVREAVQTGAVKFACIPTSEVLADMLTKPIPATEHRRHCDALNVGDGSSTDCSIGFGPQAGASRARQGISAATTDWFLLPLLFHTTHLFR